MTMNESCIFCGLIAGQAACAKVYEDDTVLAFMDIFPASVGHVLVVPKAHHETIFEMPGQALRDVAGIAGRISRAIRQVLAPDGLNVTQANGSAAGQSVPHYHVHLVPRTTGVRTRMHGSNRADDVELAALAERIAAALNQSGTEKAE